MNIPYGYDRITTSEENTSDKFIGGIFMKEKKDTLQMIADTAVKALRAVKDGIVFIFREGTDFSDPFMKTICPYSRQSFSENVRDNNKSEW